MNVCSQPGCAGTDLKCYRIFPTGKFTILCFGCASDLTSIGMNIAAVERRVTDLPVLRERRRIFRPFWLRRDNARDLTIGRAA